MAIITVDLKETLDHVPAITESGGGMTNTGHAQVVCGPNGERLEPIETPRRGYAGGDHAYYAPAVGIHIVRAYRDRRGTRITIGRLVAAPDGMEAEVIYDGSAGNAPAPFQEAAQAAAEKAECYHCRERHF